jgi:cyclopropane-fatty-acyl-phospholipid synthase
MTSGHPSGAIQTLLCWAYPTESHMPSSQEIDPPMVGAAQNSTSSRPRIKEAPAAATLDNILSSSGISCEVRWPHGQVRRYGLETPAFQLTVHNDRVLRRELDEFTFAQAYVNGDIDIEGEIATLLQLRTQIQDKVRLRPWLQFLCDLFFKSETHVNRQAILKHYQFGDELYLSFIDQRYRFYSQGIFKHANESLEDASEHKLEQMFEALQLKPGMRLLDIGGGWGGVAQYCGGKGVRVTELTLGEDSYRYIQQLIHQKQLPCEVLLQDFLTFEPDEPFDAIVIYGVIEHMVNYRRFAQQIWRCLKPNGRLFLDASASIVKYDVSTFSRRYIWGGTHTFLCLQDLIGELLRHGLQIERVQNESAHYAHTMLHWAQRLERNRNTIVARWGEPMYRAFRLYLWGGSQAFPHLLQAYHLVAQRPPHKPPVASRWRSRLGWIGRTS